jgi:hypothetical protein
MSNTTGLVQGPARIFVAPAGTTLPDEGDLAALKAGSFAGFTEVGHTTAAVTITDAPTMVEATSQQSSRVLDFAISAWDTTVATTVRSVTAANLARALHGTATSGTVNAGTAGATTKLAFAIVGPWAGGESLIVIERGVIENGLEMAFDKENFSELPLSIKVLEGNTHEAGYAIYVGTE